MAPSEHTEADAAEEPILARRIVIYVVAVVAVVVIAWALIEGGERDLWSQPPAMLRSLLVMSSVT